MATVTVEIPREYGYVLMTASASFFLAWWHGARVMSFRKAANVPYPHFYAAPTDPVDYTTEHGKDPKAVERYAFNCAQRAHAQLLESYPALLTALLASGLEYPRLASGLGAGWMVSRVLYAVGYTGQGPKGRFWGSTHWLCAFWLFGLCGKVGWDLLKG